MKRYGFAVESKKGLRRFVFENSPFCSLSRVPSVLRDTERLTSSLVICYSNSETDAPYRLLEVDLEQVLRAFCLKVAEEGKGWFTELDSELRVKIAVTVNTYRDYLLGMDVMQSYPQVHREMTEDLNNWVDQRVWADATQGANGPDLRNTDIAQLFCVALDDGLETPVRAAKVAEILTHLGMVDQGSAVLVGLALAQYPELADRLPE